MSERQKLPNWRRQETIKFEYGEHSYYVSIGYDAKVWRSRYIAAFEALIAVERFLETADCFDVVVRRRQSRAHRVEGDMAGAKIAPSRDLRGAFLRRSFSKLDPPFDFDLSRIASRLPDVFV